MHILKKFAHGLLIFLLPFILFGLSTGIVWRQTLGNQAQVTEWFASSGIYNNMVNTLVSELSKGAEGQKEGPSFSDPKVQEIFTRVLTPAYLKQSTEQVIGGVYNWLDGKTPEPDFRVDLAPIKSGLNQELTKYVKDQLASVPACSRKNPPPAEIDIFRLTCAPPGFNADKEVGKLVDDMFKDNPRLVLTAANLKNKDGKSVFDDLKQAPKSYKLLGLIPIILGSLSAAFIAGLVLLAEPKRRGWLGAAKILLSVGVSVTITGLATKFILERIRPGGDAASILAIPLVKEAAADIAMVQIWVGAIYIILAAITFVLVKKLIPTTPAAKTAK